jgi:hypothetical protein
MAVIVIGGQSRNIGKTSVICALISALREERWTAIKITHHDHPTSQTGKASIAISEEHNPTTQTDSARYLAAGAAKSFLIYAVQEQLSQAMPFIHKEIAGSKNIIIESNSILDHLHPDVYAIVLDPEVADFKFSAQRHLARANALLLITGNPQEPSWSDLLSSVPKFIATFKITPPAWFSPEFTSFIAGKLHKEGNNFAFSQK